MLYSEDTFSGITVGARCCFVAVFEQASYVMKLDCFFVTQHGAGGHDMYETNRNTTCILIFNFAQKRKEKEKKPG